MMRVSQRFDCIQLSYSSDQTCFVYCTFCAVHCLLCFIYCALYCALAGTKKKSSGEGKAFIFRVGKGLVIRGVRSSLALKLFSLVEN